MASYIIYLEGEAGTFDASKHYLMRTFINQYHTPKIHEQWCLHSWRNIWGKVVGVTGRGDGTRIYVRVSQLEFLLLHKSGYWDLIRRS